MELYCKRCDIHFEVPEKFYRDRHAQDRPICCPAGDVIEGFGRVMAHDPAAICASCGERYDEHVDQHPPGAPMPRMPCGSLKSTFVLAGDVKGPPARPSEPVQRFFDKVLEIYSVRRLEMIGRSWCNAIRSERKRRLRAISDLIIELEKIRVVTHFATAIAEGAIERIIEGDWEGAASYVDDLTFKDENIAFHYAPIWAPFVAVLRSACADKLAS